jgi:Flp pilus assembly pilin Flp
LSAKGATPRPAISHPKPRSFTDRQETIMFATLAAQIEATLHVFGQRARTERGQTTAEYVGIVAFVAMVVVALFALDEDIKGKVSGIIGDAFDYISDGFGK